MALKKVLSGLKRVVTGRKTSGPDGFPMDAKSPHFEWHCRINEFLAEVPDFTAYYQIKPGDYKSGRIILEAPEEERIVAIEAMMLRRVWVHKTEGNSFETSYALLSKVMNQLFRRELPYTSEQMGRLVAIVASQMARTHWFDDDVGPILKICERLKAQGRISSELKEVLRKLKDSMRPGSQWESAARTRFREAVDRLIARKRPDLVEAGEAWSDLGIKELERMSDKAREGWLALLEHCEKATSSSPSQKWSRTANELIEGIGRNDFKERVLRWFDAVALPRPVHREPRSRWDADPDMILTDRNSRIVKGLTWCCAGWEDKELSRALSTMAQACFKKVKNLGPRCPRIGNACLYSLSATKSDEAAAQLSRLDQLVKPPSAKKLINKSLDKAAELTGQTRADLEESTVPTFGLDDDGRLKESFGDFSGEVCISGPEAMEIVWRKADGKAQKSMPAEVKEKHADELKKFKRNLQDLEKMLPAQRNRIERLLMTEREWPLSQWRERYLDHPLLSFLTRRLIWSFKDGKQSALAAWLKGKLVDVEDRPLDWLRPETRVRLWHPLGSQPDTVAAWRRWLEMHEIVQPFKQAHREIYILTDAELQTATYSNRFAAHIIRQHQFTALARQRGWRYALQGDFDSHNTPTLILPGWNLTAEFWVNAVGNREDTSQSGIYLYLSTDQVRFAHVDGEARPLTEVPALVFSEVMRDVDLFVGVCSIGNDPAWQDSGEMEGAATYWQHYAFGDLSASAKARKDVLERLLPRLKIAPQSSLEEKFLVVKGSLKTYKIHLGSGNILMEPNNAYLCIVPDRGRSAARAEKVFLPFEGDSTLALILSKAFLLAEDDKIADESILNQIRVGGIFRAPR